MRCRNGSHVCSQLSWSWLPEAKKELENIQPQADAAKTEENKLRDQRKTLRSSNAALNEQVAEADLRVAATASEYKNAIASLTDLTGTMEDGMTDALSLLYQALSSAAESEE